MKYTKKYWDDMKAVLSNIPNITMLYGKNILITGATGMICSTVVDLCLYMNRYFDADIHVFVAGRNKTKVLERFSGFTENEGLYYIYYDATSEESIDFKESIDFIIHGASNANPAIYMKEPVETILANVLGLNNILKLSVQKKARRVLYVSSSEVYGKRHEQKAYSEEDYGFLDILNERAGYPSSKRNGEALCIAYGMEYNVDTVIIRPGHIYGPTIQSSDNRASADFTRRAVEGKNIIMKSMGNQLRSYCYVVDCATALLTVLINGERGNAYNISNPNSICTIRDIAEAIAEKAGVNVIFDIPTEAERKSFNLMSNSSLSSEKLESLGWIPAFSLESGVDSMIEILKRDNK